MKAQQRSKVILIVDDSEEDRELYKTFLESHKPSYRFYEAANAKDAVAIYPTIRPDCVLLDYLLPDINGIEVLEELAKFSSILPVVVLTGKGDETLAVDIMKRGAQDYLPKRMLTAESLQRVVDSTIDRAGLLRTIEEQTLQLKKEKTNAERLRQRAEDAKVRAEKASRSKSEFLATMSHEIRTPMNGIIGMTELLKYTPLDEKQKRYLATIQSSSDLLLTVINDILDFSKIESGELKLEHFPLILTAVVYEVFQLLSERANENQVELVLDCPEDTPYSIILDPVRLRQILFNLIGNAIKFTKNGHVLLRISTVRQVENTVTLRFNIEDTGIGIPKEKMSKLFKSFSQLDSSTTRKYGGTGLGLAICKKLVEMMGGTIGVKSQVGKGSVFWFEITAECYLYSAKSANSAVASLKGKHILLVDDREISLSVLSQYLEHYGVQPECALSGQEALRKLENAHKNGTPFEVAVVDYLMPEMDGEMLNRMVREAPERYGKPEFILLTAVGKRTEFDSLVSAGFCSYLLKPIYPHILVDAIIKGIEQHTRSMPPPVELTIRSTNNAIPQFSAHILVVEDFKPNQEVAEYILTQMGCTLEFSLNGQDAIDRLQQPDKSAFDLIFMDYQMPVLNGIEATRLIRKQAWGRDLVIIAMTAAAIDSDKDLCLNAGMNDYLTKPIRIKNVVTVLEKYLTTTKK